MVTTNFHQLPNFGDVAKTPADLPNLQQVWELILPKKNKKTKNLGGFWESILKNPQGGWELAPDSQGKRGIPESAPDSGECTALSGQEGFLLVAESIHSHRPGWRVSANG
jgi:hypothetical protein